MNTTAENVAATSAHFDARVRVLRRRLKRQGHALKLIRHREAPTLMVYDPLLGLVILEPVPQTLDCVEALIADYEAERGIDHDQDPPIPPRCGTCCWMTSKPF